MNFGWQSTDLKVPPADRGRPGPRLVRGLLWALFAFFVITLLVFWWRVVWLRELIDSIIIF